MTQEYEWHDSTEMPEIKRHVICEKEPEYEGDMDTKFIAYTDYCYCKRFFRADDDPDKCRDIKWYNLPDFISGFKWRYL